MLPNSKRPPPSATHERARKPPIIFLISVDWFFISHFVHLARRARAAGHRVIIMTRIERTGTALADEGFDVIDLPTERRGQIATGLRSATRLVREELARRPDALLHGFGVFGILVGTLAIGTQRRRPAVFTITGRGYLAAERSLSARLKRGLIRTGVAASVDRPAVRWIAENETDIEEMGLARAREQGRTAIVGGAGVDPDAFPLQLLPDAPPIKCLLVARAVWSKGIDIAVAAVERARAMGADIELTIAGDVDPANPRSHTLDEMQAFSAVPGVTWLGASRDIAGLWRSHHVALLPSRGGEGVPKSLLEAASSGRSIVTSDVPGCRDLAAVTGGVAVPVGDVAALADVLVALDVGELGTRADRARRAIVENYSEEAVWRGVKAAYDAAQADANVR